MTTGFKLYTNSRGYRYLYIPDGWQGRASRIVWVSNVLAEKIPAVGTATAEYERLPIPTAGAVAVTTEKGGCVIRPHPTNVVYLVEVESGLYGEAAITSIEGGDIALCGKVVTRPRQIAWALVNSAQDRILVSAHITGRRVTKEDVVFALTRDGRVREEEEVTDEEELLLLR